MQRWYPIYETLSGTETRGRYKWNFYEIIIPIRRSKYRILIERFKLKNLYLRVREIYKEALVLTVPHEEGSGK